MNFCHLCNKVYLMWLKFNIVFYFFERLLHYKNMNEMKYHSQKNEWHFISFDYFKFFIIIFYTTKTRRLEDLTTYLSPQDCKYLNWAWRNSWLAGLSFYQKKKKKFNIVSCHVYVSVFKNTLCQMLNIWQRFFLNTLLLYIYLSATDFCE